MLGITLQRGRCPFRAQGQPRKEIWETSRKVLDVNIHRWSQIHTWLCRVSQGQYLCVCKCRWGWGQWGGRCVCGPGYSSHVVGRCPHPSCLCWLTQFRSDTPLTCDTSLHISINTHLAQLQLNNNTHHYLATVFPQDCPCLTDHCILRTLP